MEVVRKEVFCATQKEFFSLLHLVIIFWNLILVENFVSILQDPVVIQSNFGVGFWDIHLP